MNRAHNLQPGEKEPEFKEFSRAERVEMIHRKLKVRDAKQTELLTLLTQPDKSGHVLTDAWLSLEVAQGDLDYEVESEIRERLDGPRR
jgi:hypothetical protein